jgi:hypothetical protein
MSDCPTCRNPMADVQVSISINGEPVQGFKGLLCGKCRKIWSLTEVSDAIDMRLLT